MRRRTRRGPQLLAALGLAVPVTVAVASAIFVDRYGDAPGDADDVNSRVAFSGAERYAPEGEILFVTVSAPHATALQAFVGWIDPDIDYETYAERYPDTTPVIERSRSFRMMRSAKDDAPYVALSHLGFPAELVPGPLVVDFVFCADFNVPPCAGELVPAGKFLLAGDEILAIDGVAAEVPDDLGAALRGKAPGDEVEVTVRREVLPDDPDAQVSAEPTYEEVTGRVQLVADPQDATRTIFGIRMGDTTAVKLPFAVDIDTGRVGGPSAGLAFALALTDELTPGELTGGRRIAVTGTIDVQGNVGAIGGLRQKAAAVRREGGEAFIVPASQTPEEIAEITELLGEGKVFPVATYDEALAVLAELGGNANELGLPGAED